MGRYLFTNATDVRKFRIPDYQREYVWDMDPVEHFWSDMIVDDGDSNLPFIGSFIFQKNNIDGLDIVDGQQRFITMCLMLAASRNYATEVTNNSVLATSIQKRLTPVNSLGKPLNHDLIECWPDISIFFKEYIIGNLHSSDEIIAQPADRKSELSKYNIIKNYEYFFNTLIPDYFKEKNITDNNQQDELIQKIIDEKMGSLMLVYIQVDTDEEAYAAFEIVNARGLVLGNVDLIKNLFYRTIEDRKWIKGNWDQLIKKTTGIPKINSEVFLRHFWLSRYGKSKFITAKKLFLSIKSKAGNESECKDLLENIVKDSSVYKAFYDLENLSNQNWVNDYKYNNQIRRSLKNLGLFKVIQQNIFLLSVIRNKEKFSNERTIRNIFRIVERFHFAYSVVGRGPGNRVEKFYARLAEVVETEDVANVYNDLKQNLSDIFRSTLTGELFREKFKDISYNKKEIVRFVYSILEEQILGNNEMVIDWTNANIEHIEAQVGGVNNLNRDMIDNIGNLVILSTACNGEVGNADVSAKMNIYADPECSSLQIVQQLVKFYNDNGQVWNEDMILRRAGFLADTIFDKYVYSEGSGLL